MGEAIKGGGEHEHVLGAVDPSPTAHSKLLYDHEKSVGLIQANREVKITPKYGGTFKTGDMLRIEIPTVDMLDPDNFCISFDLILKSGLLNKQLAPDAGAAYSNWSYANGENDGVLYTQKTTRTVQNFTADEPPVAPILSDSRFGIGENTITTPFINSNYATKFPQYAAQANANKAVYNPIGAGSFLTTSSGVQKMFTRVVLKQGSITVEDKQRYNYLYSTLIKSQAPMGYRKTAGFFNEGIRDADNHEQFLTSCAWSSYPNGRRYVIRPLLGLFDAGKAIPTALAGQFTLEFYFETPENFLISSAYPIGTTPTGGDEHTRSNNAIKQMFFPPSNYQVNFPNPQYEIKNVRAHCPFFVTDEAYTEKLMSKVQSGGLEIHYDTYTTHERVIQNSWAGAGHMNFQDRSVSLKGGFLVLIRNTDINDLSSELAIFSGMGMEHYQWKIGSEYIPPQDVLGEEPGFGIGSAEAFAMVEKAFDRFGEISTHGEIDYWNFARRIHKHDTANKYSAPNPYLALEDVPDSVYKRRRHGGDTHHIIPLQLEKVPGMISGYNALASNTDIEFMYRLDGNGSPFTNRGEIYCQPVLKPLTTDAGAVLNLDTVMGKSLGDPYGIAGDLVPKAAPSMFHMYFFAHKDVLFVLKDLGAVEIRM